MAAPKLRHVASIYQNFMKIIRRALQATNQRLSQIRGLYRKFLLAIGPDDGIHRNNGIRPHVSTVLWSLATFISFVVLTCVAVRVTTTPMRISYASISSGLFLLLVWIIVADLAFGSKLASLRSEIVIPKESFRTTRIQTQFIKYMHHRYAHGSVDDISILLPMVSSTQQKSPRTL